MAATGLVGKNKNAARGDVAIFGIERGLVERSEVVGDGHDAVVQVQANDAVAVVHRIGVGSGGVKGAVASGDKETPAGARTSGVVAVSG